MNITEYQKRAMRTVRPHLTTNDRLSLAGLGLSGEVGEVNELLKKYLFNGNDKALQRVQDELGDVLWYAILLCETLGISCEDVLAANIAKLEKRHPDGYLTHYDSDSKISI
jgi:NTP pyrophosphatase (non-canonical NTP hydrolase)